MAKLTIGYAVLLIAIGISFYVGTGRVSATALIPAFFGIPILVCGVLALQERHRKHAMHAAVALALVAFLGGAVRSFPQLPALIDGTSSRPSAVIAALLMTVLSLLYVILGVKSFVDVRVARNRAARDAQGASSLSATTGHRSE